MIFGVIDLMWVKNGFYFVLFVVVVLCLISVDVYVFCMFDVDVSVMLLGWCLVWFDEFNVDEFDVFKWNWEIDCWGGGNDECQCYMDFLCNFCFEDGCFVIEVYFEELMGLVWFVCLYEGLMEEQRVEIWI